jgi:uncharacterized membrane protein
MWWITILFGVALGAVGGYGYATSETKSWTALIPSAIGVVLLICGALARDDKMRKHAMHTAVLVGLIGFLVAAIRLAMKLPTVLSEGKFGENLPIQMTTLMAVLCLAFVGLCINSFVQARLARSKQPQV